MRQHCNTSTRSGIRHLKRQSRGKRDRRAAMAAAAYAKRHTDTHTAVTIDPYNPIGLISSELRVGTTSVPTLPSFPSPPTIWSGARSSPMVIVARVRARVHAVPAVWGSGSRPGTVWLLSPSGSHESRSEDDPHGVADGGARARRRREAAARAQNACVTTLARASGPRSQTPRRPGTELPERAYCGSGARCRSRCGSDQDGAPLA
jgi:hypothetical protein